MKKKLDPIEDEWMSLNDAARFTGKSRYHVNKWADESEGMGLSRYKDGRRQVSWTLLKIAKKFGWWVVLIILLLIKCTQ